MRLLRCALLLIACALLLGSACAADDIAAQIGEGIDPTDGLPEAALELIGSFDADADRSWVSDVMKVLVGAVSSVSSSVRSGLYSVGIILAAVVLCSLLSGMEHAERISGLVGVIAIAGACAGSLQTMLSLAADTIRTLNEYSLLLLPSLGALSVMSGTADAAGYSGGILFLNVLMLVCSKLLLPVVLLFSACSVADAAIGGGFFTSICDFLKWLASNLLKWTMYLFTGYLGLSEVIGRSADAIRIRTAKAALSGVVPVVGGILSEASDAILAAAGSLKSAVGVYGMLAILAVCAAPFLQIGVHYVLLKGASAISGLFGQKSLTDLIAKLSDALGMLLGLTGAYTAAALLCAALGMKAVGI